MTDNNTTNQHDQNSRNWSSTRADHCEPTGKVTDSDAERKRQGKRNSQDQCDDQDQRDMSKNNYSPKVKIYPSDQNNQRK